MQYSFESENYNKAAPVGSIGKVDFALALVGGKITLMILERTPSLGYAMLPISGSPHHKEYQQWFHAVVQQLVDVCMPLREIDQIMAISAEEVDHLRGNQVIAEDVLENYYGRSHFLEDLGFELIRLPLGTKIHFPGAAAFHIADFRGPFWVHSLKGPTTSPQKESGELDRLVGADPEVQSAA